MKRERKHLLQWQTAAMCLACLPTTGATREEHPVVTELMSKIFRGAGLTEERSRLQAGLALLHVIRQTLNHGC